MTTIGCFWNGCQVYLQGIAITVAPLRTEKVHIWTAMHTAQICTQLSLWVVAAKNLQICILATTLSRRTSLIGF
jgi:predicted ATPase with chaperone activity